MIRLLLNDALRERLQPLDRPDPVSAPAEEDLAVLAPKGSRPRNNDRLVAMGQAKARPLTTFSASHWRSARSAAASNSSTVL